MAGRRFGTFHVLALTCQRGKDGVRLAVDGKMHRARDRGDAAIALDELRLGARYYSNTADPAVPQGFFHGDIAEVLVYGRALVGRRANGGRSVSVEKTRRPARPLPALPPKIPIKMLAPGFTVRELPVELTNINDAVYAPDGRLYALGYDGRIHVLQDSDGDGLEDRVTPFWDKPTLKSPIAMALAPEGLYVTSIGKISLFKDANQRQPRRRGRDRRQRLGKARQLLRRRRCPGAGPRVRRQPVLSRSAATISRTPTGFATASRSIARPASAAR